MPADPVYVAARCVLLDALEALGAHRSSAVLVGAQAVYLWAGEGDFAVAPRTVDADIALDVSVLAAEPELFEAMKRALFEEGAQPGTWLGRGKVPVDLLVASHQAGRSGKSARAARIPPHRTGVARIVRGLEPALVDHSPMRVAALEDADSRAFEVRVAGPAALLVAKLIKFGERIDAEQAGERSRVRAKDALDALRLLRAFGAGLLVKGLRLHRQDSNARASSEEAIRQLRQHGTRQDGRLAVLASEAVGGDPIVAASFAALAGELVEGLGRL